MNDNKNEMNYKKIDSLSKKRKFIEEKLIVYKESEFEDEFAKLMKEGYIEMSKINLDFSIYESPQEKVADYKFDDINEYEKWLCGV